MDNSNKSKPLLDEMREVLRRQGYSYATGTMYIGSHRGQTVNRGIIDRP